jgi:hypothetical protein
VNFDALNSDGSHGSFLGSGGRLVMEPHFHLPKFSG